MKNIVILSSIVFSIFCTVCCGSKQKEDPVLKKGVDFATAQITMQLNESAQGKELLNPKTILPSGKTHYISPKEWTSGFFPGQLWYLYDLTKDDKWKDWAEKYTLTLDSVQYITDDHDVGFMIGCSYGNGLRFADKNDYKNVIIQAAKSLTTRYRPEAKIIQSWDVKGWVVEKGWKCPVIIDNMMNLELLFEAFSLSNDSTFYNVAVAHANTTLKNHFRANGSCYHVIDYDPETGEVLNKHTAQGYSHESIWARGQAWAIYGYTMMYRYTKDPIYLQQAEKTAEMMLSHPNLEKDLVPFWDMDIPNITTQPRDVSSAAIIASAFYEMNSYCSKDYKAIADKIIENLTEPAYLAELGKNNNFILMHSVGSIPHGFEIDVPLNYADYYFLEALSRRNNLNLYGKIYKSWEK